MKIRKKLIKDILTTTLVLLTSTSFIFASIILGSAVKGQVVGIILVMSFPIIASVIGFIRRIQLYPKEGIINGNRVIIKYYGKRELNLSLSDIKELKMLIHSQRTAILEFKYFNEDSAYLTVQFRRAEYTNFIEFSKEIISLKYSTEPPKIERIKDNVAKERSEFISDLEWEVYLIQKKTGSVVLKEVVSENLVKKLFAVVALIAVAIMKNYEIGDDITSIILFFAFIYFIYLIIGFILRLKGFSRKETVEHFIVGMLTFFCILGGCVTIIALIFNLNIYD